MIDAILTVTAWLMLITVAVMAGVYFAFSVFVMRAFDRLPARQAIDAMNSINLVIVRSYFLPLFFGSSMLALLLVIFSLFHWQGLASVWAMMAAVGYLVTMFLSTALFNVPLNNGLADFEPHRQNADTTWAHYRQHWTRWNHVRTIGSLVSVVLSAVHLGWV